MKIIILYYHIKLYVHHMMQKGEIEKINGPITIYGNIMWFSLYFCADQCVKMTFYVMKILKMFS